jgi:hypothetical protein
VVFVVFLFTRREVKAAEKKMDENCFEVRQPKMFLICGIICGAFFLGLTVWAAVFPDDSTEWWVFLVFLFFVLLGLALTVYCAVWKIKIDGDRIVCRQFIGKEKSFAFSEITKVKLKNQQSVKAYSSDKVIFKAEWNCKGFNVLVERLRKEQIPIES